MSDQTEYKAAIEVHRFNIDQKAVFKRLLDLIELVEDISKARPEFRDLLSALRDASDALPDRRPEP